MRPRKRCLPWHLPSSSNPALSGAPVVRGHFDPPSHVPADFTTPVGLVHVLGIAAGLEFAPVLAQHVRFDHRGVVFQQAQRTAQPHAVVANVPGGWQEYLVARIFFREQREKMRRSEILEDTVATNSPTSLAPQYSCQKIFLPILPPLLEPPMSAYPRMQGGPVDRLAAGLVASIEWRAGSPRWGLAGSIHGGGIWASVVAPVRLASGQSGRWRGVAESPGFGERLAGTPGGDPSRWPPQDPRRTIGVRNYPVFAPGLLDVLQL